MLKLKFFIPLLLLPTLALAQPKLDGLDAKKAGQALADYAEKHHAGWKSLKSEGRMVIIDAKGGKAENTLWTYALERNKKHDGRAIIKFDSEGTALLTHAFKKSPDAQWIWLPDLKRKWRIKASSESNAFIGSEFAYEDLRSQYADKFTFELLGEEDIDGKKHWKLKRFPKLEDSAYSHHIAWMDQEHFRIIKVDFYDKQDRLMKTSKSTDWEKINDKNWRAKSTHMHNHLTGRASTILVDMIELDTGLTSSHFKPGRKILR